jgi:hypothetical protein
MEQKIIAFLIFLNNLNFPHQNKNIVDFERVFQN